MNGWNGMAWQAGNPDLPEALPCADSKVNDLLKRYNALGADLAAANAAVAAIQAKEHAARDADVEAHADAILAGKKAPSGVHYKAWLTEIEEARNKATATERARNKIFGELKYKTLSDRDAWRQRVNGELDEHVEKLNALLDEIHNVWVSATLLVATSQFLDQEAYWHIAPGLLNGETAETTIKNLKADVMNQFG